MNNNNVLILLDSLRDWAPYYQTNSLLTVLDYLQYKNGEKSRKLVINLSNDYSYNSEGYYCSLLAQPRGHQVIPGIDIINTLCKHYDVYAPIFIDNREAVTKLEESQSQVVNLIVSGADKQLRVA